MLSLLLLTPLVGALVVALLPAAMARLGALAVSGAALAVAALVLAGFDPAVATDTAPQLAERVGPWLPGLDVYYAVGLDGLNVWLVGLVAVLAPLLVLYAWNRVERSAPAFFALLLALEGFALGAFLAFDLLTFYVFFELTLVPTYFLIALWGGTEDGFEDAGAPGRAALKFVVYTLVGSLVMLVGILWLGFAAGKASGIGFTTDWYRLVAFGVPAEAQLGLFVLLAVALLIKAPLFPFHTWLPDAYREAPIAGTVMLAAVLGKMGTYGLVRWVVPVVPSAVAQVAPLVGLLCAVGIVYAGLVAFAQSDVKRLIAYSSVSHLGFVILGVFALNVEALQGSLFQMLAHGISTGALFLCAGMLVQRTGTHDLRRMGGIATAAPVLTFFTLLAAFASSGLPGLSNFVGEFLILLGAFGSEAIDNRWIVGAATTGVVFAAVYILAMVYHAFFGPRALRSPLAEGAVVTDLGGREIALLVPLAALMVGLGWWSAPLLRASEPAVQAVMQTVQAKRAAAAASPAAAFSVPLQWPHPILLDAPAPVAPVADPGDPAAPPSR